MRIDSILAMLLVLGSSTLASATGAQPPPHTPVAAAVAQGARYGSRGNARDVTRTIDISLLDTMRIVPDRLDIRPGETVRLRVHNSGATPHEFVLGDQQEIIEHRDMMRTMPTMQNDEPNAVSVAPGATAEIVWRFSKPGSFLYACLIPGHWESGMQGSVTVGAKQGRSE